MYDIAIIGGGPAGLTAAIKAGTEGLRALVIEKDRVGGRPVQSPLIENVPGWPEGVSGPELFGRMHRQAEKFGAEFVKTHVIGLQRIALPGDPKGAYLTVSAQRGWGDKAEYGGFDARSVIVAAGEITPRLDALKDWEGRGVDYSCEAARLSHPDEHVVLVGGGNSCAQLALAIEEQGAKSVTIITRSPMQDTTSLYLRSRLAQSNVRIILGEVEKATSGATLNGRELGDRVKALKIVRGERFTKTIKADQTYVFISGIPPTGWFPGALDASGYILTGHDVPVEDWPLERHPLPQETSIPGVFAAGDIRAGATGGITVAFGEGTQAFQHIKRTYLPDLEAQTTTKEEVPA